MQIYFNSLYNNQYYHSFRGTGSQITSPLLSMGSNISANVESAGQKLLRPKYIAHTDIERITSEEEFDKVLNKLMNHTTWLGGWWNRSNATKFEQALMPYAGEEDRHFVINWYMLDGKVPSIPGFTDDIIREYIRAMDYALPEIDKTYGKYKGILYRCGKMDNVARTFVSAASDPSGLTRIITSREDYHKPFHIILDVEDGHKIEEMQKKLCREYAGEREIILSPGTRFEDVTEITPQMLDLKNNLQNELRDEFGHVHELNVKFHREIHN